MLPLSVWECMNRGNQAKAEIDHSSNSMRGRVKWIEVGSFCGFWSCRKNASLNSESEETHQQENRRWNKHCCAPSSERPSVTSCSTLISITQLLYLLHQRGSFSFAVIPVSLSLPGDSDWENQCFRLFWLHNGVFPLCWNSSLIFPWDIDPGGWLNSKTKEGADLSTDDDIFSSAITLCSQHLLQNKLNKNKSITSLKPWKIDIQTLCMIRRPGTGSKLGHHQTCKLHPARAWNSCTEWNSNPSCSCWDNSVWSGGLIHNLANSISQNVLLIPCFSLFFSLNCPQIRTHPSSKWACSPQDRPRDNVVCEKHQPTGVQLHPQVCRLHPPGRLLLCQLQTRLHRSHTASTHPGQCDR